MDDLAAQDWQHWTDLADTLDASGGVLRTTMDRLTPLVTDKDRTRTEAMAPKIQQGLGLRGVGCDPDPLPVRKDGEVLLYRLGTRPGEVILALKHHEFPESVVQILRRMNEPEAADMAMYPEVEKMLTAAEDSAREARRIWTDAMETRQRRRGLFRRPAT